MPRRRPDRPHPRRATARAGSRKEAANPSPRSPRRDRLPAQPDVPQPDVPPWEPELWIDEGVIESEPAPDRRSRDKPRAGRYASAARGDSAVLPEGAPGAAPAESRRGKSLDEDLRAGVADPRQRERAERALKAATEDFHHGRFRDARAKLRPLAERAPRVAAVRELHGLTLYRLGHWKLAARELEAFRSLTGSVQQDPVLADCYRALRRYERVQELWSELRAARPSEPLLMEGRIVVAGALADQGRLSDAISLLSRSVARGLRTKEHHLRAAYALADLYEQAGDLPRARELFQRIADYDPRFVDVQARLAALA
jgi:tetratricopeptide (TPR) repeat protein